MITSARWSGAVVLTLVGWMVIMALVMRLSETAPAALVMFPSETLMRNLPQGVAVTGRTAISVTLRRGKTGIAADLYAAGARLVLPAGLQGCLPSPQI